ncbi:MAG: hypothetical protein QNJ98_11580 [Planctomycetota bacterium]|nr:hypothetical protein [Planctomycetota bacterium]
MRVVHRLLFVLLLGLFAVPAEARDERRGTATEPLARAMAKLESPLARDREEGIEELVKLLPGARKEILAALEKAPWEVRASLVQVLAQDGSDAAIRALLDVLAEADDAQAARVFLRIASDEITAKRLLNSLRTDRARFAGKGKVRLRRLDDLYGLLLRAELEEKFISRKSPTGSTGYYRGQYDVLKYARREALQMVLHIAMDKAIRVPGVYRTGPYRFLQPKPIDFWEIRDMATNAIGELALPEDEEVLLRLEAYALRLRQDVELEAEKVELFGMRAFGEKDRVEHQEMQEDFGIKVGRYGDLLTALHTVQKNDESRFAIRKYLYLVERRWVGNLRFGRSTATHIKATTLIRAGWYEEAVRVYTDLLRDYYSSKSTAHYNIACAYASWSLDPELSAEEQAYKRSQALRSLERAVDAGWTDLGWMDEDGDLNPIRDTPRYRALVVRIKRELGIK